MVLSIKNFNIFGVHWKIWLLGGITKNKYIGGLTKRVGLDSLLISGGWGGWYPNAHYDYKILTHAHYDYTFLLKIAKNSTITKKGLWWFYDRICDESGKWTP